MFVIKTLLNGLKAEAHVITFYDEIGDPNVINGLQKVVTREIGDISIYEDDADITDQVSKEDLESYKNEILSDYD